MTTSSIRSLRASDEALQGLAQTRAGTQRRGCLLNRSQLFDDKKRTNMHHSKMKQLIQVSLESNIWVVLSRVYFIYLLNVDCVERCPPIPSC